MTGFTYIGGELHLFEKAVSWKAYWRSHLLPHVTGNVLEVGAGIGANTSCFAQSGYRRWLCLEPDASLCTELRANVQQLRDVDVMVGMLDSLPEDERFDTILYLDVLEHIQDDRGELQRAAAHIRPGGHLIVLSPAHQRLFTPFDQAIGHFRRYSSGSLRAAVPRELSLVFLRYLDAAGMLASGLNRLLLRRSIPTEVQILFWDRCLMPISRLLDPILGYRVGKSILGIWQRED